MAPRPKDKHRTWCKMCQQFEIHSWHDEKDLVCEKCNCVYTPYHTSEVPLELLEIQRKRYKNQKFEKVDSYLNMIKPNNIIFDVLTQMSGDFPKANIIECDAGQKVIDNHRHQLIIEQRNKINAKEKEYIDNYSKLSRNDKCSCGSGLKYKNCHLLIFRKDLKL